MPVSRDSMGGESVPVPPIVFGSVCSGIEAASVAWEPLGFKPAFFAEIEPFPSAVLAHHWPDVPNLGDFTAIGSHWLGGVDVLIGGTPCQAFSVAGQRRSLDDARGNLTLAFVDMIHAARSLFCALWENVPGVLSTKDNAFGCFLAALVGADAPLHSPLERGRWPDSGLVSGPWGGAAWRVLDAQHFGVPQRRKRVFLVFCPVASGGDPAKILFEQKGVHWNSSEGGETGKDLAGALSARSQGGGGLGTDFDLSGGLQIAPTLRAGGNATGGDRPPGTDVDTCETLVPVLAWPLTAGMSASSSRMPHEQGALIPVRQAFGGGNCSGPLEVTATLTATLTAKGNRQDFEVETFIAESYPADIAHTLKAEGFDGSEDGTGRQNLVPVCFSGNDCGGDALYDMAPTLRAENHDKSHANAGTPPPVAYAIQERALCENPNAGPDGAGFREGTAYTLEARTVPQSVAYGISADAVDRSGDAVDRSGDAASGQAGDRSGLGISPELSPTIKAAKPNAVAFALRGRDGGAQAAIEGQITGALRAGGGGSSNSYVATDDEVAFSVSNNSNGFAWETDRPPTVDTSVGSTGNQMSGIRTGSAVRRLLPVECARLQGFPDNHTAITVRGKPSADGPQYKAYGNSMAVPVIRWLGRRIKADMARVAVGDA